jgi:N-methylhydantoinase B
MMAAAKAVDAVELEIIRASLDGIVQEMQNSLFRTGFSTIVVIDHV